MQYGKVEICGVNTSRLRLLSEEQKRALLQTIRNGTPAERKRARDEMINGNLRLVLSVIQRFVGRGENPDDLFQVGVIGLIKAIDNFDPRLDVRFSTYGVPMIIGEIRRYLRDDNPMHIARSIADNARRIEALRAERLQAGEPEPSLEALGRALHLSGADVVLALNARQPVRSLTEPASGNEDILLQETLGQECMAEVDDHILLRDLLAARPDAERSLLVRRYFYAHTQSQIARDTGMTQVQVSRMEKRILKHMRQMAEGE